jgi:hypothetical protein
VHTLSVSKGLDFVKGPNLLEMAAVQSWGPFDGSPGILAQQQYTHVSTSIRNITKTMIPPARTCLSSTHQSPSLVDACAIWDVVSSPLRCTACMPHMSPAPLLKRSLRTFYLLLCSELLGETELAEGKYSELLANSNCCAWRSVSEWSQRLGEVQLCMTAAALTSQQHSHVELWGGANVQGDHTSDNSHDTLHACARAV